MNRKLLAGLATLGLAAGITLATAGAASAHSGSGGLTNSRCIDGTAWAVTLTINATDAALHPVATVIYTGNSMQGVALPYSHVFTTQAATFTAQAHIVWDDGFAHDVGPWTATKPDGCVPPATTTSPPTTTCEQAIPPRADCGTPTTTNPPAPTTVPEATTVPPTTVPATTPTTVCTTPVTLEDGSQGCNDTYHAPPDVPPDVPPTNLPASSKQISQLPATGAGVSIAVALGVCLILFGLALWGYQAIENRRLCRLHDEVRDQVNGRDQGVPR